MRQKTFVSLLFVFLAAVGYGQQTPRSFTRETRYLLYLPEGYESDTSKRWPLMLFLHGSGERGTDIEQVKKNGPPLLIEKGKKYPFIVVSPQSDSPFGWDPNELYLLLQDLKRKYRTDPDRVYLTGLSMGGFGSFKLAMNHPGEFAAVIPICGGGDTATAWKLRHMGVWAFHGAKDNAVMPEQSKRMIREIKKDNPSARLTIYPDEMHDSWTAAYNTDSLYEWMLSQRRFKYKELPVEEKVLSTLTGIYVNKTDTLHLVVNEGKLVVKTNSNNSVVLRPASEKLFFINEETPVDLEFVKRGQQASLIINADTRDEYKKVK